MISVNTPQSVTAAINALCSELVVAPSPLYLSLHAEKYAQHGDCYGAVSEKMRRDGGTTQYGWIIWQTDELMIEAEFHAVWKSPEGNLLDITPKVDGESTVLFLPDPVRIDEGGRIDNIRRALKQDRVIEDFISACERAYKANEKMMFDHTLMVTSEQARQMKSALMSMLVQNHGQHDRCFCGEGASYLDCHAATIQKILNEPI